MNMRGTNNDRNAASSFVHEVVSVSSTTSETDVATRVTISAALVSPCDVSPTSWPNQVPSGTTMAPGVMRFSVAGRTTMPVKMGTKSQTRLTKKPSDSLDIAARSERGGVGRDQHRQVAHERHGDEQAEQRDDLHPWVEPLQQARLCRGVLGEHGLRHDAGARVHGLRDVAALAAPADAATRAQPDLGLEQPRRRRLRGRGHACAASRRLRLRTCTSLNVMSTTPAMTNVPTSAETT